MKYLLTLTLLLSALPLHAQQPVQFKVEVLEVLSTQQEVLPGLQGDRTTQTLRVQTLTGEDEGAIFELENDFFLSEPGDRFYVTKTQNDLGDPLYAIGEPDRQNVLLITVLLAALAVILLGGFHGVRALLALILSIGVLFTILIPGLLAGMSPILIGSGVAILILAIVMGLTHGISKTTLAAFLGTAAAVVVASILAHLTTTAAKLSGLVSDEAIFLNLLTNNTLDLSGIFLAAVIIGMIGVLDDVSVTQAAAVRELLASGMRRKEAFVRSIRIGREHVGALVNTLALAYAGVSLPLLLIFAHSESPIFQVLNREIFAAEIIRTAVGTVGIVLAVPLTTTIAIFLLTGKEKDTGHSHTHTH